MYAFRNHRDNDLEYVGILATDQDMNPDGYSNKQAVFINTNGDIQYNVKALSENAPKRLFTGYINSIINSEDLDVPKEAYSEDQRILDFKQAVSDSLFLFTSYTKGEFTKVSQAILLPMQSETITNDSILTSVPVFSPKDFTQEFETTNQYFLAKKYNSYEEFLQLLAQNQFLGKIAHYQGPEEFPRFIIWKDDSSITAIGPFTTGLLNYNGMALRYTELYKIDISSFLPDCIDNEYNPTVLQIKQQEYEKILSQLLTKQGEPVFPPSTITSPTSTMPSDNTTSEPSNEPLAATSLLKNEIYENDPIILNTEEKNEKLFLQLFKYHCESKNLFYDAKDLSNFHTAVKTGSIVILSGMSGTGKSALVDAYARSLGVTSGSKNQLLTIPVRPAWNDDSDLLGYVDLVHRVYRPSDTGLIKHLIDASTNNKDLYLICLDEMNLARVEHYFSQFLSILEKPVGQRILHLYDEEYIGNLYNAKDYPHSIKIGDNVKFIGTVNIDESTYHFADKVLDRANVINLKVTDYRTWKPTRYSFGSRIDWSYEDYKKFVFEDITPIAELRKFLWELHTILNDTNANLGVGPRIVINIEKYIHNTPDCDAEFELSFDAALDFQLKQRILTKLRGPREQFGDILADESHESSLLYVMEKYNSLSTFTMSKQVIAQKQKEIKIYGYCL